MRVPLLLLRCVLFLTAEGSACGDDEIPAGGSCIKCSKNNPDNPYSVPNDAKTGCVDCKAGEIVKAGKCACDTENKIYEAKDGKCVECKKNEVFDELTTTCRQCPHGSYPTQSSIPKDFNSTTHCKKCANEEVRKGYAAFCKSKLPGSKLKENGTEELILTLEGQTRSEFDGATFTDSNKLRNYLDKLAESNDFAMCTGVCLKMNAETSEVTITTDAENLDIWGDQKRCQDLIDSEETDLYLYHEFEWVRGQSEIPAWNDVGVASSCVSCGTLKDSSVTLGKKDDDGKMWFSQFVNLLDQDECKCDVDEIREKGACRKCEDDEVPNNLGTACISCGEGRKRTIIRDKYLGPNTADNPDNTVVGKAVCECDASNGAYEEAGLCKVCPLDSVLKKVIGSDGSTVYSCDRCDLAGGSFPNATREACMQCNDPQTEIPSGFLTGLCQVCGDWENVSLLPAKKTISDFRDNKSDNYRCTPQDLEPGQNVEDFNKRKCRKGEYTTHIRSAVFVDAKASCLPLCAAERHPEAGGVAPADTVYFDDLKLNKDDISFVESDKFGYLDEYLRIHTQEEPHSPANPPVGQAALNSSFGTTLGLGNLEDPGCNECRSKAHPSVFPVNEIAVDDYLLIGEDALKVLNRDGDVFRVKNADENAPIRKVAYDVLTPIVHVGARNRQYRYTTMKGATMIAQPDMMWIKIGDIDASNPSEQVTDAEGFATLLGVAKSRSKDGRKRDELFNEVAEVQLVQFTKPVYIQIGKEIMEVLETGDDSAATPTGQSTGQSILVKRAQLGTSKEEHGDAAAIYQLPVSSKDSGDTLKLGKLEKIRLTGNQIFEDEDRVSVFGKGEDSLSLHYDPSNPGNALLHWTATSTTTAFSEMLFQPGSGFFVTSNTIESTVKSGGSRTNDFLSKIEVLEPIHQTQFVTEQSTGGTSAAWDGNSHDLKFRFKPSRNGKVWVRAIDDENLTKVKDNLGDLRLEDVLVDGQSLDTKINDLTGTPVLNTKPSCRVTAEPIFANMWKEISLTCSGAGATGFNAVDDEYTVIVYVDGDELAGEGTFQELKIKIPTPYLGLTSATQGQNIFIRQPSITAMDRRTVHFSFQLHAVPTTSCLLYAAIYKDVEANYGKAKAVNDASGVTELTKQTILEATNDNQGNPVQPSGGALDEEMWVSPEGGFAANTTDNCRINGFDLSNLSCFGEVCDTSDAAFSGGQLINCNLDFDTDYRLVVATKNNGDYWSEIISLHGPAFKIPETTIFANPPADADHLSFEPKIVIGTESMGFARFAQNIHGSAGVDIRVERDNTDSREHAVGSSVSLLRLALPPIDHEFASGPREKRPFNLSWNFAHLATALTADECTTDCTADLMSTEFCTLLPILEGGSAIEAPVCYERSATNCDPLLGGGKGVFVSTGCEQRKKEFEGIIVRIDDEYIKVKEYKSQQTAGEIKKDRLEIERGLFGSTRAIHAEGATVRLYEYFDGIANIGSASWKNYNRDEHKHPLPDHTQGFVFNDDLGYCVRSKPGYITKDNLEEIGCISSEVPNRAKTQCVPCGFEGAVRNPDNEDKCKCEYANHGQDSGVVLKDGQNTSDCRACKSYEYVDSNTNECTTCPLGQYPSADKKECLPCEDGEIPTFTFDGCQLCGDGTDPANRGKCNGCPAKQVLQNSVCVQAQRVGNGVDLWIPLTNELDYDVTELGYLQLWNFVEGTGSLAGKVVYTHDDHDIRPVTNQMFSVYSNCGELCSTKHVDLEQIIELYYKDDDLNKVPVCPCEWAYDLQTNDNVLDAPGIGARDGFSLLSKEVNESGEYKNSATFKDLRNYFASLKRGNCATEYPCGDSCDIYAHVGVRRDTEVQINPLDGKPLREIVLKENGTCNLLGVCKERVPSYTCEDPKRFAEFLSDDADFASKLTFLIDHYQPVKSGLDTPENAQLYHQYLRELSEALDRAFGRRYQEGAPSWFPDVTKLADVYDLNEGDFCVDFPFIYGCSDIVMTPEQQLYSEDCELLTTDKLFSYAGEKRGCAVIQNFGPTNATAEKVRKIVISQLELNLDGDLDAWKDSTGGYPTQKVFDMESRSKLFDGVDSDGARDLSAVDSTDPEFLKKYQEVWVEVGNRELEFFFGKLVTKAQEGEKWDDVMATAQTAWNGSNLNKTFWINLIQTLQNDAEVQNLEVSNVILILAVFFKIYPYEEYQLAGTSDTTAPQTCGDYFAVNVNSKTCFPGYVKKAGFAALSIQGDDFGAILNQCCDWADNTATGTKPCNDWLTEVNNGLCFDGYEEVVGATCNAGLCKFDECCEHSDPTSVSPTTTTTTEVLLEIDLGTDSSVKKEGSGIVEGPNGTTGKADYYLRTEITHKIRISKIMASYCALIGPPEGAASATMYNSQIVYEEIQPLQLPIGEGNLSELELNLFGTQIGGKKEIAKVHLQPGCTFKSDDPNHKNISEVFAFSMNANMIMPMEFSSFVADVDLKLTPVLMKRTYSCSCEPTITSTLVEIKNTFVDILTTYEVLGEPSSKKITVWVYGMAGLPENTITIITDKSSITEQKVLQGKWVKKQIEIKDFSIQMVVTASKQFQNQKFLFYSQTASKGYVENPSKSCKVGGNDQCVFMAMNTFSHADSATEAIKASYKITQLNMQEEVVEKYFHGAFNEQLLAEDRFDANGNRQNTSGASSFTKFGSFVLTLVF